MLSDRRYNQLKLLASLLLPGVAAAYFALAEIWGLPYGAQVSGTVSVINVFVGVLLAFAKALHEATGARFDGHMVIEETEEGSRLRMRNVDVVALDTKDELTFKLIRDTPVGGLAE